MQKIGKTKWKRSASLIPFFIFMHGYVRSLQQTISRTIGVLSRKFYPRPSLKTSLTKVITSIFYHLGLAIKVSHKLPSFKILLWAVITHRRN